jgi:hypothetical protein
MARISRRQGWTAAVLTLVVVGAAVAVAAFWNPSTTSATSEASTEQPATVEEIAGSDVKRVRLADEAAKRLGIKTEAARSEPVAGTAAVVIPYAAVFYDPSGTAWTYTSPEPLTFVRQKIVVANIRGNDALLTEGPAAGTQVVTVGSAELYGTEVGVGGDE